MGKFLGELSGFLMIFLIGILFMKFLMDMKVIKKEESIRSFRNISLYVIGMGMLYLLLGGFIFNFSIENSVSIAQIDKIWNYGKFADTLSLLGKGSGEGLINWIYLGIVNLFGRLFFHQYVACSLYASFIFSIMAIWLFYCGMKRIAGSKSAWYFVTLSLVLPYSFCLFLPSPVSLLCLVISGIFYCIIIIADLHIIPKLESLTWRCFGGECLWLLICILNGFVMYQDIIKR